MWKANPFVVITRITLLTLSTAITECFSLNSGIEPFCLRHIHEWKARVSGWYPENDYADEFDVHHFLSTNYAKRKDSPLAFQFNPDHVDKTLITPESIGKQLAAVPRDRSVFVKDVPLGITDHYHHLPNGMSGYKYAFLIRNPERVMPSLRAMLFRQVSMSFGNDVTLEDFDFISDTPYMEEGVFYKSQYDLWKYVKENIDPNPVVIDSEDVLANPADMLSKFCNALGMPWDDSLVSWDPSPSIATSWRVIYPLVTQGTRNEIEDCAHANTLASSGFQPSRPKIPLDELTSDVLRAIEATEGYYAEMAAPRIRPSLC